MSPPVTSRLGAPGGRPCLASASGSAGLLNLVAVGRQLISLTIPIVGANAMGVLDASINSMWVGRYLGDAALAATSNANTVLLFVFAMAIGIWTALTIQVGFCFGNRRDEDTRSLIRAAWVVFASVGIAVAIAGELLSARLLKALGVPPESFGQAEQYLRLILLYVPICYLYGMVIAVLRGRGDTKTTFYFLLLSIGLDVGFNPLLIFGLGPIPQLGISGAALATVLSEGAGLVGLVLFLLRRGHPVCLARGQVFLRRSDWKFAGELLRRGVPMGVEFLGQSLLAILMLSLINRFGADVTAAFGVVNQLWNIVMMPSVAVSMAATAMVANSFGAGNRERARITTWVGVTFSVLSAGALLLVLIGLNTRIFALFFPPHSPAQPIAGEINWIASWSCIALAGCGALMVTPRAAGAIWGPFTVSALVLVIRYVLARDLLRYWEIQGIWWSFPVSSVIAMIGTALYYRRGSWRSAQLLGQRRALAAVEWTEPRG